mmetsp:Transcript_66615/g.159200  ORF Transcript_66615/g.159200 Transcript_66615/m.159200 type:complete len:778 (+) Transcript_66615:104-2437(+)
MGQCCEKPAEVDSSVLMVPPSNDPHHREAVQFLSKVELFKRLPPDMLPVLAMTCAKKVFSNGQLIIQQGDTGNDFYIIMQGSAKVLVDGKEVATLKSGDYFGEGALIRDEPRNATIVSSSQMVTMNITRDKFKGMGLSEKLDFPARKAVGGGIDSAPPSKPPGPKSKAERALMTQALQQNQNLAAVVSLTQDTINELIDIAWKESVPAGTSIIKEGSMDADYFYIVQEGTFDIQVSSEQQAAASSSDTKMRRQTQAMYFSPGSSFGELALLYLAPRAATITARTAAGVWVIDRTNFKTILAKSTAKAAKEYMKYIDKVELLSPLTPKEREQLAEALQECSFSKGETIFEQGEKGNEFFILIEGEVLVEKDRKETARLIATAEKAQFFGERALLTNEPRAATIKVTSTNGAKALKVDKTSFDLLLGPLEALKSRAKGEQTKPAGPVKQKPAARSKAKILRADLDRLTLLGCGGFGSVELVEHKKTKETYALKALSKGYIVKCGMKSSVIREKDIQLMCDSPFVVHLYETYNGQQSLYLLLELALGGELYATYNKKGLHGSAQLAQFYIAGTTFAFDHLHERKVLFRDLKPENLLLNDKGWVKLTDMGLAKVVVGKTFTTCGTPDYFAPELIASIGHNQAVDWWTLGILLFELMTGHPPFEAVTPMQTYSKVKRGIQKVVFPKALRGPCEELVKSLCDRDPAQRLPMKKGGSKNIKNHNWYKGFDWAAMEAQTLTPPYIPVVKSTTDSSNFNAKKADLPPQVPYKDDGSEWDKDFATSE